MTIEWRYTVQQELGVLSLAGFLGADALGRFTGAVGWAVARGTGPVVLDLSRLRGWSAGGQLAVSEAAHRLRAAGRSLELAAIPTDGALVPAGDGPAIPVHCDLDAAFAAHLDAGAEQRAWRSDAWPSE
ncbi:anti-sigma factor antagonist [Streptomyces sp. NBC_01255]|uniref:anti-sigma factor antagonist n=1 Tax=Streptomyces sp. NBC_01255 TaxID=2903798 RepID=UPI002E35F42C|nr:anti-sigma factor antagonist [Streptomyces sp. NBC_01255]